MATYVAPLTSGTVALPSANLTRWSARSVALLTPALIDVLASVGAPYAFSTTCHRPCRSRHESHLVRRSLIPLPQAPIHLLSAYHSDQLRVQRLDAHKRRLLRLARQRRVEPVEQRAHNLARRVLGRQLHLWGNGQRGRVGRGQGGGREGA